MTALLEPGSITRTVDARGSYCPGPLMELIRAIREGGPGQVIAVYSTDSGSRTDIPKWVEKAGHGLIGVFDTFGIGFHDWHPAKAFDVYYDDVVLDTKRIGCPAP